jgi:long-chain acyl-CoA synthetase
MIHDPILDHFVHLAAARAASPMFVAANRCASVGDVHALARSVTDAARAATLEPGSMVGLAAGNGPAFAAGYLGLRRAGCRVVLMDARTPPHERERIHQSLGCAAELLAASGWPSSADEITLREIDSATPQKKLDDDVSTIRLTSGSSGQPRGIAHTSEALLADDAALRSTMALADECALASVPLSHAYGFASIFLPAVTRGWPIATPVGIGPFAAIEAANLGEVTFLPAVPAYLQALLKMEDPPPLPESVRLVITAGAPLKPETAELFFRQYGRHVHVFYGASEVGGITFDRVGTAGLRGTLGSPVDGVTVRLEPIPGGDDETGVVTVQSPAAAITRFPEPDPSLAGGRFRTSDLGRFEKGELRLLGRIDAMINVRGKKVNPREVETVIETMPEVDEAVVAGIAAEPGGDPAVAALVAVATADVAAADVLSWCGTRLAFHKVPRLIRVVDAVPRTERGKVDRLAVRRLLSSPEPQA